VAAVKHQTCPTRHYTLPCQSVDGVSPFALQHKHANGHHLLHYENCKYTQKKREQVLGAFQKFRNTDRLASSCLSVRLSTWNNSAPTGRIFEKFDTYNIFRKRFYKSQ
jgi:hypothetical protein